MNCIGCGNCCKKHWLLRLTSEYEKSLFEGFIVFGEYIWTDLCPYLKDNKCTIQADKPYRCKQYFCENHE
jgi:Fe-S-cluster containining protein